MKIRKQRISDPKKILACLLIIPLVLGCNMENCMTCPDPSICANCNIGFHLSVTVIDNSESTSCEANTRNCSQYDEEHKSCSKCDYRYALQWSSSSSTYHCISKNPRISRGLYAFFFFLICGGSCAYIIYMVFSSDEFKELKKKRQRQKEEREKQREKEREREENYHDEEARSGDNVRKTEEPFSSNRPLNNEGRKNSLKNHSNSFINFQREIL